MKKQTAKLKTQADREKHNKLPSEDSIRRHMLKRNNCQEREDVAIGRTMLAIGIVLPETVDALIIETLEGALGIELNGEIPDIIETLLNRAIGPDAVTMLLDAPPSDPALLRENEHDVMFVRLSVSQKITVPAEPEA